MKSFIKKCLINLIRFYFCIAKISKIYFNPQKVKKVLVLAYTGLGNFILYTPALRSIKSIVPHAKFTLLHGDDFGCHEVLSGSDFFLKFIVIKKNVNWWTKIKWIYKVRKEKFDLVISEFHNNNFFLAFLSILSGARYRLGHVSSPGWKNDWDCIYNIPAKMKNNQHEIDRYLELAFALGVSEQAVDRSLFIQINSDDIKFARNFLASHGINSSDKIISVQVGTSPNDRWKQWNLDKYIKLCDKIMEVYNAKVILLGSSGEVDMIKSICNRMKQNPILAAGKTTIKQAAAIIKESTLLICNDSGLMHISVAVDTPVVAIYGPTDYKRTAPLGDKHTIIRKNLECSPCFKMEGAEKVENCPYGYNCLNSISEDKVFNEVIRKIR